MEQKLYVKENNTMPTDSNEPNNANLNISDGFHPRKGCIVIRNGKSFSRKGCIAKNPTPQNFFTGGKVGFKNSNFIMKNKNMKTFINDVVKKLTPEEKLQLSNLILHNHVLWEKLNIIEYKNNKWIRFNINSKLNIRADKKLGYPIMSIPKNVSNLKFIKNICDCGVYLHLLYIKHNDDDNAIEELVDNSNYDILIKLTNIYPKLYNDKPDNELYKIYNDIESNFDNYNTCFTIPNPNHLIKYNSRFKNIIIRIDKINNMKIALRKMRVELKQIKEKTLHKLEKYKKKFNIKLNKMKDIVKTHYYKTNHYSDHKSNSIYSIIKSYINDFQNKYSTSNPEKYIHIKKVEVYIYPPIYYEYFSKDNYHYNFITDLIVIQLGNNKYGYKTYNIDEVQFVNFSKSQFKSSDLSKCNIIRYEGNFIIKEYRFIKFKKYRIHEYILNKNEIIELIKHFIKCFGNI